MDNAATASISHDKVKVAILLGLKKFGRAKTFAQILDEAGLQHDASLRFTAASALEAAGLIKEVSYQLPVSIKAELSAEGEEFVKTKLLANPNFGEGFSRYMAL